MRWQRQPRFDATKGTQRRDITPSFRRLLAAELPFPADDEPDDPARSLAKGGDR
jgi:hypothetical protein